MLSYFTEEGEASMPGDDMDMAALQQGMGGGMPGMPGMGGMGGMPGMMGGAGGPGGAFHSTPI